MSTQDTTLPPLPEPFGLFCGVRLTPPQTTEFWGMLTARETGGEKCNLYTENQMQAYAKAAIAAQAQQLTPRCEGCGYLVTHREHLSCVRAMKQAQQPAAVKESLTLEQVEAIADVDDAAYCLLAILQRVGPGATVGQVLAILEQAQQAQGVPQTSTPAVAGEHGTGYVRVRIDTTPRVGRAFVTPQSGEYPGEWNDGAQFFGVLAAAPQAEPAAPSASAKAVACIQHINGDKGRLFFIDEVAPPPGSDSYIEAVSWTLLAPITRATPKGEPQPEREPLTAEQLHTVECMDSWAKMRGLPAYSELAGIGTKGGE